MRELPQTDDEDILAGRAGARAREMVAAVVDALGRHGPLAPPARELEAARTSVFAEEVFVERRSGGVSSTRTRRDCSIAPGEPFS